MATATTSNTYSLSPRVFFVDEHGRLTTEGFRIMKAALQLVSAIAIDDGEITTAKLATGAVTTAKIDTDAVTADKISVSNLEAISATLGNVAVTGSLVVDGTLTVGKYQDGSISTAKVASNAVSASSVYFSSGTIDVSQGTGAVEVASATLTPSGKSGSRVEVSFVCELYPYIPGGLGTGNEGVFTAKLKKGGSAVTGAELTAQILYTGSVYSNELIVINYVESSPAASSATWSVDVEFSSGAGAYDHCRNRILKVVDAKA